MKGLYRSCHSLVLCTLLAVIFVLTASHAMAIPITWTGKTSMPTARSRAASGVVNGKIFVLGGNIGGSTTVEMYDAAKDTWQAWPPLAQPIYAPCQVTLGDTIYMVGMNSSQVIAYRTFIHPGLANPLPVPSPSGVSEVVGSLNTTRSSRAQAALVNKKMYIVGTGPNMDQIEEFDLTTYTSVTKNARLPAGRDLPMVAAFEGRIFIMGGISGGAATTTVWQYDPASDSLFESGSLPSPMAGNMVATWGGKIYIAGANTDGANPPAWDGTLREYDVRGGTWNTFDAAPTSRYAATVQVWNGSLYVIGGDSGGTPSTNLSTNEAARLPSGSPRWTVRDSNTPPVVHPSIATVNGKIFMLGGRTSVNFSGQAEVYSFDPTAPTPAWQRMPDLAAPILAAPAAVHGQKIYLAGGESPNGPTTADIQYYDTATTPFTTGIAASLRYPRAKAGAAILNDRLYVIGGGTAAIEEFDLTTTPITRTERVDYLPEALFQPSVVAANGRIYIMGGTVASGPAAYTVTDVCLIYDPMGPPGSFTPCASMPVALDENEGAALIDGKIYLVGGGTNGLYSPEATTAVQKYDPMIDTWEVSDTMSASRRDHGIAYTNGHIYVMGGWLNGGGIWASTTEQYIIPFIWRVGSYSGEAVDWSGSLHGTVPTGSYLLIGGKYYFVRASYAGSWNGPGFNMAVLQQCDQYSGEPLTDPANPGMPLAPDLSGTAFQAIELLVSWQPRTRPAWTVSSVDPANPAGIDWPAGAHGQVTPGTYLQVGATIYYVMASGAGSWQGSDYVHAYLYNCNPITGEANGTADMRGSEGAAISTYTFVPQQFAVTATATGNGTINCDSPVTAGGSSICTITPATGHFLQGLTDNGVDARAGVVNNLYTISNVSTDHTIAATFAPTGASSVWAWGYNYQGQLGDGTNQDKTTAVQITGFDDVRSIAGGMSYSIALKWDGTVWGWGDNYDGGLGNGTFDNINTPQQNPYLSNVKTIATGWFHTLALKNDNTVWRWGNYNRFDPAMADINSLNSNTPVEVSGLTGVIALAGGENHSLALKADGTVWAWGGNVKGQLGTGYFNNSTVPVQVTNLDNVIAIAAGVSHSVALKADGTVWTWGYNASGQLGDGTVLDSPIPVQVQGLATVTAIAGGHDHTVALKADGTVWAWGLNMDGQLGDGTTTNSSIPVQAIGLAGITAIDAECRSTFALRADGTVWEWGTYYVNQAYKTDSSPVQVPGLTGITAIAGGMDHRLALKGGGQQGNWTVNSSSYGLIDWLASQHETVSYRNYLKINNTYYFVNGSWNESWNGSQYNVADLLECDQTSGRILYLNPFQPRQPDLAGTEGQAITLFTSWPGGEEANPLQLMTTSPDAVATGFPIGNPITVTFSAPIDPASVNASTFGVRRWDVGGPVGAFVSGSWSSNGATAIFTPSEPLSLNTRYLAAIVDVMDQTGNHQASQYSWSFTTAAAAPVISVSPSFFDFGVMQVLSSSSPLFTISNIGTAPLTVSSTSIGGSQPADFFVSPYTCTSLTPTLAPGASCTVAVNFIPTGTGTVSASLQIGSDDTATPLVTVPLTATVVPQNHTLNLSFSGNGNGSISFSTGDNCSGTCNPSFPAGTVISLTPTATAGSLFTGWSGCDSVTGNVCTVTMSSARSVTATFDLSGPPAPVWTTGSPLPIGLSRAFSAVVNGSIYILGGSPSTAAVQRYNPQTDTWTQQAPLPVPLYGGAAAAEGTTIYLAGGFNSAMSFQSAILAYDTVTGTTEQIGNLVTPRARMNGTILNNRLYVVGGTNGSDTIEMFDLTTRTGGIVATLPEPTELAGVIGNLTDLYIFGGGSDNTKSWRFDTLSNTFYPLPPSPQPVKARAATFDSGRILLVDAWAYNGSNAVLAYSFPLDSWSIATSVPTLRNVPMVEAVDGVIYVMGGDSAGGNLNEAWRFNSTPPVATHVVTPTAGPNGSIAPATQQTVTDGATTSFTIQPYPGYQIDTVSGCGGTLSGTTFTTGPITADCTVSATFVQNNPAGLCTTVDMVWYSEGSEIRRDFNCASGQQSPSGYCYSFTTDACSGYRCVAGNTITPACYSQTECAASCNGTCVNIATMRQTCSNPTASYTVTPAAGPNGSISPAVPQTVNSGSTISFTIQPYPGYHISSVSGCGGTLSGNTYTTSPILGACTVNAFFAADSAGDSCTRVDMVWYSGGSEIRRDFNCASAQQSPSGYCYSYQTDGCSGYRCVTGNEISPACYSESQCAAACGGQCVQIPTQKTFCASVPVDYPVLATIVGSGSVHSSVAPDINCASGTCGQAYPGGTTLQLTATPATGSDFASWIGCDSVANTVCTLSSISAARRVTATFTPSGTAVFANAAPMTVAREFHTATLLPNGKVLITGGWPGLNSAELYDPQSDSWSPAGSLTIGRHSHTANLLQNGKVLVAGGYPNKASAELYDPATNSWSPVGDLATGRSAHTATLLPDGRVLVAAGYDPLANIPLASAEIYDPASSSWAAAGTLAEARQWHSATLLSNGRVLVVGGSTTHSAMNSLASAELYDPATNSWSMTGNVANSRQQHTAAVLTGGNVLITGGWGSGGMQATSEIYNPATGSWSTAGSMAKARFFHTATALPNGKVLAAGGHIATYEENNPLASAEIYDAGTNTWSSAGNMAYAREYHTETLMPDGRVLIVGGYGTNGALASAEIFGAIENSHTLTVTLTGSGQGTVHSSPAPDIACLSGVCSQSYDRGTVVTLTATAGTGFTFAGWGDDCTGTGQCQVTMNAGKVVKAIFVPLGDTVPPAITTFAMPAAAETLTVPVNTFLASDNVAVTGYLISESASPPAAGSGGWSSTPPTSFTFMAPGNCYAYAWVKDSAGNVSVASIAMVSVTIPNPVDTVAPLITSFIIGSSSSLSVPITLAVTDNVGIAGYLVTEDPTMPLSGDSRWSSTSPTNYTFANYGNKTLYAWAKDASENISAGVMATTLIMDPDEALNTVITGWPANPMPYSPSVFTFIANRPGATFECSMDNQGYFPCSSPISLGSLANGSHTFTVRAKDGGATDTTPATFSWTVNLPLVQVLYNTYPSVLDAYLATPDGSNLKIKGIEFREDLVFNRPVSITLQGGYDSAYFSNSGTSTIHGSIAIDQGTVTIDGITIM